tara:strand:- start:304 stop:561 length:258 start_codon:yes stop_codon:yes gene_type:complete
MLLIQYNSSQTNLPRPHCSTTNLQPTPEEVLVQQYVNPSAVCARAALLTFTSQFSKLIACKRLAARLIDCKRLFLDFVGENEVMS